jgi:WD40 repeat protein
MIGPRLPVLVLLLLAAPLPAQSPRLDRLGEPLPAGAKARLGSLRYQHNRLVYSFTPSPDGRLLGVVCPGDVCFVEAATGRPLTRVRTPPHTFHSLAFSGDGRQFALVGYREGLIFSQAIVLLGEVATGAVLQQFEVAVTGPYPRPQLSRDGRFLVLWASHQKAMAVVWDTHTRREAWRAETAFRFPDTTIPCLLAPDGRLLAGAQRDDTIKLWDALSGREVHRLAGGPSPVRALAFAPDGRTLAVGGYGPPNWLGEVETTVHLFDVGTGQLRHRLSDPIMSAVSLEFAPDGNSLLLRSADQTLVLWDVRTGQPLVRLPSSASHRARAAAFAPDGRTLAWVEETCPAGRQLSTVLLETWLPRGPFPTIRLWDIAAGEELRRWKTQCEVSVLKFAADGRTLVAAGSSALAFDVDTGHRLPRFAGPLSALRWLEYAPDGKSLAAIDDERGLYLWDAAEGRQRPLEDAADVEGLEEARFAAGGELLIAQEITGTFRIWDCAHGKLRRQFRVPERDGLRCHWSADGRTLAVFDNRGETVQLWDVIAGRPGATWPAHKGGVRHCLFSPDGRTLVTSGNDQTAAVWTCPAGKELVRLPCPGGWSNTSVSDDSRFLALDASTRLWLWDREQQAFLWEQPDVGYSVGFSADGKTLVTSHSYAVSLRDTATGEELYRFDRSDGNFSSISLLPRMRGRLLGHTQDTVHDLAANRPLLEAVRYLPGMRTDPTDPIALSPDGRTVAVGGLKVAVADVEQGKPLGWLPAHKRLTTVLAFSPDGRTLATGGTDGTVLLWDVSGLQDGWPAQLVAYSVGELATLWDRLGDAPPPSERPPLAREQAMQQLVAAPRQAVPFLAGKLKTELVPNAGRVRGLIAQLNADDFDKREEATRELAKLGRIAGPGLKEVLAGDAPPETKRRIRELLDAHDMSEREPRGMCQGRAAVCILEMLGSGPARRALEEIAHGPNGSWLNQDAADALQRLQDGSRGPSSFERRFRDPSPP